MYNAGEVLRKQVREDWDTPEKDSYSFGVFYVDEKHGLGIKFNQSVEDIKRIVDGRLAEAEKPENFNDQNWVVIVDHDTGAIGMYNAWELQDILQAERVAFLQNKIHELEEAIQNRNTQNDTKNSPPTIEIQKLQGAFCYNIAEKRQWSAKLRGFRKEHHLSRQELASLLGVTTPVVEYWEGCKHKPSANSALKIGALFNKFNGAGAVTKILGQPPEERLIGQIDKKAFERLVRTKAPKNIIAMGLRCTEQLIDTWCNAVYGAQYFTVKKRLLKGRM